MPPPPREDGSRRAVALNTRREEALLCKAKRQFSRGARTCEGPWVSSSASSGQKLVVERDSRTAARGTPAR